MFATPKLRRIAVAAAIVALAVLTSGAGAAIRAAGAASPAVDIEIAVDTTGSMAPSVARAKALGDSFAASVAGALPNAHFGVVQFRDPGNPAGEYQLLQPMTADGQAVTAAIAKLQTSQNPTPGNVAEESYNLAFHQSWADSRMGWRAGARKVVVVIGDAEPFGAGAAGLAGCKSKAKDPHGYNTANELALMASKQRTLVFVRAVSTATTASLACYQSMAARAYPGGSAVDDVAAGDLSVSIRRVVETGLAPLQGRAAPIFGRPGSTLTLAVTVRNPNPFTFTVRNVSFTLPSGFALAPNQQQWTAVGGKAQLSGSAPVPKSLTLSARLKSPAAAARGSLIASATIVLPDGNTFDESTSVSLATARSFRIALSGSKTQTAGGTVVVSFAGKGSARGTARFGKGAAAWRLRTATASLAQSTSASTVTLGGTWLHSATCAAGHGKLVATLRRDPATGHVVVAYSASRPCGRSAAHRRGSAAAAVTEVR